MKSSEREREKMEEVEKETKYRTLTDILGPGVARDQRPV